MSATAKPDTLARPTTAPSFALVDQVDVDGLRVAVVRAALELDLFTHLWPGHVDEESLRVAITATPDGIRLMVRALLSLEMVVREADGTLSNAPVAQAYLTPQSEASFAPILLSWLRNRDLLADVVRGRTVAKDHASGSAAGLWRAYAAPDLTRWPTLVDVAEERLAERGVRVPPGGRVLDLGCGSALVGLTLARHAPGSRVVAVDRREVLEVAEGLAADMRLAERLECRAGDVRTVEPETAAYDVVLLTNVAQYLTRPELLDVLARARRALRPGGVLQLVTPVVDEGSPGWSANWSTAVEMFLSSPGVELRDDAEVRSVLREAGFATADRWPPHAYTAR